MIILGIDPGLERIGYAVIEKQGSQLRALGYGLIETPRVDLGLRLQQIARDVKELLAQHEPDAVAIERLFFAKNQTTAMDVAKAVGCIMLSVADAGKECHEYAPPQVKQSVVGNGSADKRQVQFMVTRLLGLAAAPKPDDVADACAIAICHALRAGLPGSSSDHPSR
jgi:crossover junction endodeoxyribonuclease RuvC